MSVKVFFFPLPSQRENSINNDGGFDSGNLLPGRRLFQMELLKGDSCSSGIDRQVEKMVMEENRQRNKIGIDHQSIEKKKHFLYGWNAENESRINF